MKKSIILLSLITPFIYNCTTSTPLPRPSSSNLVNSSPTIVNYSPGGSPSASPSPSTYDASEKIAFMSNRSGFWDIYNMNPDGTNIQRITNDDMRGPFAFSISPDGRKIAYISDKSGNPDLWYKDLNTKDTIQITDTETADEGSPTWSSDSQRIAFHSNSKTSVYSILQVSYPFSKGESTQALVSEQELNALHPAYSPDGTKLLYAITDSQGVNKLHIYDYTSQKDSIATTQDDQAVNGSWSPDSNKIIYWTNTNGIYQINSDLTGKAQIGSVKNIKGTPYFSPDGKKIVLARGYGFADDYDVWIMDNDGRNPKKITTEGGLSVAWYKVNKTPASVAPTISPTSSNGTYSPVPSGNPYIDPNDPLVNP